MAPIDYARWASASYDDDDAVPTASAAGAEPPAQKRVNLDDAELNALKDAGNVLFRARDYAGAAQKYSEALGGEDSIGNGMEVGISTTLLNNRAACHLEIADAIRDINDAISVERIGVYEDASRDAKHAVMMLRMSGDAQLPKALFRQGRAILGVQLCSKRILDKLQERGQISAAELQDGRKSIAKNLSECAVHLHSAHEMKPDDRMILRQLEEAEALQAELARVGAPPISQGPIPLPQPEAFAANVRFTEGSSWIGNVVALEMPIVTRTRAEVRLPIYLSKQENDNNMGELAIWIHMSDHLGEEVLKERCAALGMDPEYDVCAGQPYGVLSTPAQDSNDIQSPNEFVLALAWNRSADQAHSVAALEAGGVISHVRVAGATPFGEQFRIYRSNF